MLNRTMAHVVRLISIQLELGGMFLGVLQKRLDQVV